MVAKPQPPKPIAPKVVAGMMKQALGIVGSTNTALYSSAYNTKGVAPSVISPTVKDAAGNTSSLSTLPSVSEASSGLTKKSLLPYAIRKVAAKEMLYGGARVIGLVQPPPAIVYHRSDLMKLPTPRQEVDMEGFEVEEFGVRMFPNNVGFRSRHHMLLLRNKDLLRRFNVAHRSTLDPTSGGGGGDAPVFDRSTYTRTRTVFGVPSSIGVSHSKAAATGEGHHQVSEANPADGGGLPPSRRRRYHPRPEDLSILPDTASNIYRDGSAHFARARTLSSGVPLVGVYASPFHDQEVEASGQSANVFSLCSFYDQERQRQLIALSGAGGDVPYTGFVFKPFQMVMPVSGVFTYAMRSEGLRSPSGHLRQETLDRKGFGWRKKQRAMWQQDVGTRGFKPDRFY